MTAMQQWWFSAPPYTAPPVPPPPLPNEFAYWDTREVARDSVVDYSLDLSAPGWVNLQAPFAPFEHLHLRPTPTTLYTNGNDLWTRRVVEVGFIRTPVIFMFKADNNLQVWIDGVEHTSSLRGVGNLVQEMTYTPVANTFVVHVRYHEAQAPGAGNYSYGGCNMWHDGEIADPFIGNVSLLMPLNDRYDLSPTVKSVPMPYSVFSTESLLFDRPTAKFTAGAAGVVGAAVTPSGTEDFTVECYAMLDEAVPEANAMILSAYPTGNRSSEFGVNSGGLPFMRASSNGSSDTIGYPSGPAMTIGQWHHLAWVRNGTSFTVYRDGVPGPTPYTSSASIIPPSASANIAQTSDLVWRFPGKLAQLRVTLGVARYTAAFTPTFKVFPTY